MANPILLGVLIVLNGVVLLGQLWPAGAPPFARWVNIAFLTLSLVVFLAQAAGSWRGRGAKRPPAVDG